MNFPAITHNGNISVIEPMMPIFHLEMSLGKKDLTRHSAARLGQIALERELFIQCVIGVYRRKLACRGDTIDHRTMHSRVARRHRSGRQVDQIVSLQRPHELIDPSMLSAQDAAELISDFVRRHKIRILNIAGPRQSEWAQGYDYAFCALEAFLTYGTG